MDKLYARYCIRCGNPYILSSIFQWRITTNSMTHTKKKTFLSDIHASVSWYVIDISYVTWYVTRKYENILDVVQWRIVTITIADEDFSIV
jgi:hypothetical protein